MKTRYDCGAYPRNCKKNSRKSFGSNLMRIFSSFYCPSKHDFLGMLMMMRNCCARISLCIGVTVTMKCSVISFIAAYSHSILASNDCNLAWRVSPNGVEQLDTWKGTRKASKECHHHLQVVARTLHNFSSLKHFSCDYAERVLLSRRKEWQHDGEWTPTIMAALRWEFHMNMWIVWELNHRYFLTNSLTLTVVWFFCGKKSFPENRKPSLPKKSVIMHRVPRGDFQGE